MSLPSKQITVIEVGVVEETTGLEWRREAGQVFSSCFTLSPTQRKDTPTLRRAVKVADVHGLIASPGYLLGSIARVLAGFTLSQVVKKVKTDPGCLEQDGTANLFPLTWGNVGVVRFKDGRPRFAEVFPDDPNVCRGQEVHRLIVLA